MTDDDKPYKKGEAKRLLKKQLRELAAKQAQAKRKRAREVGGGDETGFYCLECKGNGKKPFCGTCGAKK